MLERFDQTGSRAVVAAAEQARALGHAYVGTEHVLLGLLCGGDRTVLETLAAFDLDPADVRRAVDEADRRAG